MRTQISRVGRWLLWFGTPALTLSSCGRVASDGSLPELAAGAPPQAQVPKQPVPAETAEVACVALTSPEPEMDFSDLQIEYACGYRSAEAERYSNFFAGGTRCDDGEINTFALKLKGRAAAGYSAVVRCGYIRYDNGTFVGERLAVEARDGQWCHEAALERMDLVDRMLLTDVSFAVEPRGAAPARGVRARFSTRAGWTDPVPADKNLCAYVAHRQAGQAGDWACRMVSSVPYCVCPCGEAWEDFFSGAELSLIRR